MSKAGEEYKKYFGTEIIDKDAILFAEHLYQSRINAVSDDDIDKHVDTLAYNDELSDENFNRGVKWFKKQLLKKINNDKIVSYT